MQQNRGNDNTVDESGMDNNAVKVHADGIDYAVGWEEEMANNKNRYITVEKEVEKPRNRCWEVHHSLGLL